MRITRLPIIIGFAMALASGFASGAETATPANGANKIENIDFATLPGGRVNITLQMSRPMQNIPPGFVMGNPPRIVLDFLDTTNATQKNSIAVDQGILKTANFAQAKGRTRLVLNLNKAAK